MGIPHPAYRSLPLDDTARALGGLRLPLLLCGLLVMLSAAFPPPAGGASRDYDLTVIVFAGDPGQTQVAASYSHTVDHAVVQARATALTGELGVPMSGLTIDDSPLVRGTEGLSTAVEFQAPGLVVSGQPLPLAAILRGLPDWQHARVAFVVGNGFAFVGPGDGTGVGNAVARLVGSGSSYEYDVEKGHQGTSTPARITPSQSTAARRALPTRKAPPALGRIVLLSGTLVVAAAAVAAWHSKARAGGLVAVSCTQARFVSKPRGARPGTVQIRRETVLRVRPGLPAADAEG